MAKEPAINEMDGGTYEVFACDNEHVHVRLTMPDGPVELVFPEPDEADNFAQALLRAYDEAEGITAPTDE